MSHFRSVKEYQSQLAKSVGGTGWIMQTYRIDDTYHVLIDAGPRRRAVIENRLGIVDPDCELR
jgi:hypothetical protein